MAKLKFELTEYVIFSLRVTRCQYFNEIQKVTCAYNLYIAKFLFVKCLL